MPRLPSGVQLIERGWLSANAVVFDDGAGLELVDTGYVSHAPQLLALVDRLCAGRPLRRVLNTHLHSDHAGGNAALQRRWAVPVWIPAGTARAVGDWDGQALSYESTGQECPRFTHQGVLRDGDALRLGGLDWQVLAAPGHDPDMVMLFQPQHGVLVSADALWENGFGAIFPEVEGPGGFADQEAVLDRIQELAPAVVLPGHGPAFGAAGPALQRARERLAALRTSPHRNARHVLKVLIKFHLLRVRSLSLAELTAHFAPTRYACVIHERYFAAEPFAAMISKAVGELAAAGVLQQTNDRIADV